MANFGFSVRDIILISSYAKGVYRSCKRAGEDFREIKADVKSLQSHLDALNGELERPESSVNKQSRVRLKEIEALLQGCEHDLNELDQVLFRYKSLRTTDPRARDRIRFTSRKQADIRAKITGHSTRLQQMLASVNIGTLSRIEGNTEYQVLSLAQLKSRVDEIYRAVVASKRDPSILTNIQHWNESDEIFEDAATEVDLEVKSMINDWLEHAQPINDVETLVRSIVSKEASPTKSPKYSTRAYAHKRKDIYKNKSSGSRELILVF